MTKKIIVAILLLIIVAYGLMVYGNWKREPLDCKVETIYIDTVDDLTTKRTINFLTKGTITGIEISIDGYILGTGAVTIGYNDTTSYREYKLDSGKIEIEHRSDWYADRCFVSVLPTMPTKGKLEITCNFIGD